MSKQAQSKEDMAQQKTHDEKVTPQITRPLDPGMSTSGIPSDFDRNRITRLCVCRGDNKCHMKDPLEGNMFSTLKDLDNFLAKMGEEAVQNISEKKVRNKIEVSWDPMEGCSLFYIFLFNNANKRIRELEIILDQSTQSYEFDKSRGLTHVRVLALYEQKDDHGFVEIVEGRGLRKKKFVIDLSVVTNENRDTPSNREIRFGFLSSLFSFHYSVTRAAFRKFNLADETSIERMEGQIEIAMRVGGPHNTKYLACTEIKINTDIWIAMEVCGMGTLDILIDKKWWFLLEKHKIETCMKHILLGLIQLHNIGIKHGNMVMENILVSSDGNYLKISDYCHIQHRDRDRDDTGTDIQQTALLFFKCLKLNSKSNADIAVREKEKDTPSESNISKCWIDKLNDLSNELGGDGDAYLGAYLIMCMYHDQLTSEEVLNHPFFWDQHEILDFVTEMAGDLFKSKNKKKSKLRIIHQEFTSACKKQCPIIKWTERVRCSLMNDSRNQKKSKLEAVHDILKRINKGVEDQTYDSSDIVSFLRHIRNVYAHYRTANIMYFESAADLWMFYRNVYPWMICLLHRAVWLQRNGITGDLRHFLHKSKNTDTLDYKG